MEILQYHSAVNPEWWLKRIGESDWTGGQYLHQVLKEQRFQALYGKTAEVLLLTDGSRIASFCSYAEKDEIPEMELTPWVGFVYTYPEYRGRHLMGKLVAEARRMAREDGFDTLYISTEENGLYEKYGAEFLTVLRDRRGGNSRIYRINTYGFYGWEKADFQATKQELPGIGTPKDLYNALWHLWSRETCAPRMRGDWSEDNRTLGQCSITAFLAQDLFGGRVYGIPLEDGGFHCYNVVGECVFDLTSEQFGGKALCYEQNPEQTRHQHFMKQEKRERYEALKKALQERLHGG